MNSQLHSISAGSSGTNTRSGAYSRRLLKDRVAGYVFTLGGWAILFSICAILLVIFLEALPLFSAPTVTQGQTEQIDGDVTSFFIGDYKEKLLAIHADGSHQSVSLKDSENKALIPGDLTAALTTINQRGNKEVYAGTSDGRVLRGVAAFSPSFNQGVRTIEASLKWDEEFSVLNTLPIAEDAIAHGTIIAVAAGTARNSKLILVQTGPESLVLYEQKVKRGLMGGGTRQEKAIPFTIPNGKVTTIAMDSRADYALVANDEGLVFTYELRGKLDASAVRKYKVSDRAVSSMTFALGGRTLLIGDSAGAISTWLFVRPKGSDQHSLKRINSFEAHDSAVMLIEPSRRNKVFITAAIAGDLKVHYATSGKTLASIASPFAPGEKVAALRLAPKGNGIFALSDVGNLYQWDFYNPHPEISFKTLFGKVHYEGFDEAEYSWQSSGATDEFEPKISLLPLLLGTLKGTLYALIFSVPLALLGAFYASQFMSPRLKSFVKPSLEVMAALPSVVIGFVAGLWLAPLLEPHLLAIFCMPLCLLIALVFVCLLYWQASQRFGFKQRLGAELLIAMPIMALAIWLSFPVAEYIEAVFFAGDLNQWLFSSVGIRVDQRNSIIAGIAVGFAVIPIIFTISEDCLSSVPKALSAGSLALGATRWQTSLKVVFPVAAPGIFAAIMIGLGRAVGETMIVLMATGNTPIMDLSAFTGFRALSANIAVELPEAPHGGTLYRVLFLTAFILFVMTFFLNTLSEFVRVRLRKKFGGV